MAHRRVNVVAVHRGAQQRLARCHPLRPIVSSSVARYCPRRIRECGILSISGPKRVVIATHGSRAAGHHCKSFYISDLMAERVGFEPTVEFPLHTLSKRAPSTTRTSLRVFRISGLRASGPAQKPDCDRNCDTSLTVSDHLRARRPTLPQTQPV